MPRYQGESVVVDLDKTGLERWLRQSPEKADDAVEALAREGERIVKMSFNTSPAGRVYRLPNGVIHVASQPGSPPNIDTGTLMNSINVENRGKAKRSINAGTDYALYLEYGTVRGLAARPFMRPMAMQLEKIADDIFVRFFRA